MLALLLAPAVAHAQVTPLSKWTDDKFSSIILHPTVAADGGRIDCAPGNPGCKPLNVARCTDTSILPIDFVVSPGASGLPAYTGTNQKLYAFLGTTAGCVYSTVAGQTGYDPNNQLLIGTTSSLFGGAPFFATGTQSFRFPTGVSTFNSKVTAAGSTGIFTVGEMMQALGVCPPNAPVQMGTYFLCLGVDADASQGIGNGTNSAAATTTPTTQGAASGTDPVAYLQFQVDTQPPPTPTIRQVDALNGRVRVDVDYDASTLDIWTLRLRYTKDPANLATAPDAEGALMPRRCDAWTGDIESVVKTVYGQATATVPFTVDGLDNDTTYAFCADAVDYMENPSVPTDTVLGEPRFECDLFACYPDELQVGYCAQAGAPQLWLMASAGLLAVWQRRARRR